ncbi:MAG TPA: lipid-A-disaccharide synthase [Burkholderiaceae bacterium]|jgi:lipid-A-disaccharide synthase|nr:lipid-A-disaccharide synthase [Burkholderiaceae bacterium]
MATGVGEPGERATAWRLGLVAGEASGDLLASLLLEGLQARWPGLAAAGIGGPRLQARGFEAWWPSSKLSVFGYVDALRHYPELAGIRRRLGDRLILERPRLFVGVDAPDFNFGLERRLKEAGMKTVHFVCPSIWAWRGRRVKTLGAAADHVLCLFPFEPQLLHSHGIAATFVGHPLASVIPLEPPRAAARQALGLRLSEPVVALLPGSRTSEIRLLGPRLLAAAAMMRRDRADLRFVLPVAPGLRPQVAELVARHAPDAGIGLLEGRSHEALAACDVTLVASGTATLEAALFKRPMVVTYGVSALNFLLMRRMRYQPWVALPNILCRDFVVPELLQEAATPQALARETMAWLDDAPRCRAVEQRFLELHHVLRRDTARESADAIAQVLEA